MLEGDLPGDFTIFLCLCKGDLNGELTFNVISSFLHSVLLNGD